MVAEISSDQAEAAAVVAVHALSLRLPAIVSFPVERQWGMLYERNEK
jgi:hypothetical protein